MEFKKTMVVFNCRIIKLKKVLQGQSLKKNYSWTQNQQPWVPLYRILFLTMHFDVLGHICPKKVL